MKTAKLSDLNTDGEQRVETQIKSPGDNEEIIWNRFLQGDQESIIYLYRKYTKSLYRYGSQFTSRSELLKDTIQDLFYELIDKRKKLSSARSVKGYLFVSLKRKLVRRLKKEEKIKFEDEGFRFLLESQSTSINENLEKRDYAIIQRQLNLLPVNQREVILLFFFEGLSYKEISVIMGIKVRSTRALTYRALKSLQSKLEPFKNRLLTIALIISTPVF